MSTGMPSDRSAYAGSSCGSHGQRTTQLVPSKHPAAHSQTFTSRLALGGQPHAPRRQVLGKSPAEAQHRRREGIPPELRQARAPASGVAVGVAGGRLVTVGVGTG